MEWYANWIFKLYHCLTSIKNIFELSKIFSLEMKTRLKLKGMNSTLILTGNGKREWMDELDDCIYCSPGGLCVWVDGRRLSFLPSFLKFRSGALISFSLLYLCISYGLEPHTITIARGTLLKISSFMEIESGKIRLLWEYLYYVYSKLISDQRENGVWPYSMATLQSLRLPISKSQVSSSSFSIAQRPSSSIRDREDWKL
jgi:hypothetical protein